MDDRCVLELTLRLFVSLGDDGTGERRLIINGNDFAQFRMGFQNIRQPPDFGRHNRHPGHPSLQNHAAKRLISTEQHKTVCRPHDVGDTVGINRPVKMDLFGNSEFQDKRLIPLQVTLNLPCPTDQVQGDSWPCLTRLTKCTQHARDVLVVVLHRADMKQTQWGRWLAGCRRWRKTSFDHIRHNALPHIRSKRRHGAAQTL